MENVPQSRRAFIAKVALLFGSALLLRRYLTPHLPARRTVLVSVPISEIPSQGALVYREQRLALLRDGTGFYALSLVCTHLGCTVTVSSGHLSCPCHGSEFDRQGKVLKGPADRALLRMKVEVRDGKVEVLA